jgi:hypothetical protein
MRTTIEIDDPILKQLKRLQRRERKSLGRLVSDLLAESLSRQAVAGPQRASFEWISKPMGARIDLADKDALRDALDARAE